MEAHGLGVSRGDVSEALPLEQAAMSAVCWESVDCIVM